MKEKHAEKWFKILLIAYTIAKYEIANIKNLRALEALKLEVVFYNTFNCWLSVRWLFKKFFLVKDKFTPTLLYNFQNFAVSHVRKNELLVWFD